MPIKPPNFKLIAKIAATLARAAWWLKNNGVHTPMTTIVIALMGVAAVLSIALEREQHTSRTLKVNIALVQTENRILRKQLAEYEGQGCYQPAPYIPPTD